MKSLLAVNLELEQETKKVRAIKTIQVRRILNRNLKSMKQLSLLSILREMI